MLQPSCAPSHGPHASVSALNWAHTELALKAEAQTLAVQGPKRSSHALASFRANT